MFDLVVLGARGDDREAELAMKELDTRTQAKFAAIIPQIRKQCRLEDAPARP